MTSPINIDIGSFSEFTVDTLTGLGNIFAFLAQAENALTQARIEKNYVSLILMSVYEYQEICDSYGTENGEHIIRTIATAVCSVVEEKGHSPVNSVYRFGGSEFAILTSDMACHEVDDLVNTIQHKVEQIKWRKLKDDEFTVSMAASAICYPFCASSLGHLIAYAELFLRKSQQKGAGRLSCPKNQENQDVHQLSMELHQSSVLLIETLTKKVIETLNVIQETRELAYTDPISELPNQRAARKFLEEAFANNDEITLMLIDGDDLRQYNNQFDYEVGNNMIRALGRIIRNHASETCFVARWLSGDEFLVVCPSKDKCEVHERAEQLRLSVSELSQKWPLPITISIGLATYPEDADNIEDLLYQAEVANKRAKDAGKNRVISL